MGSGKREGVGGVKEERLGSCVYVGGRRRWGERREVLHMILFRGGGFKTFGKSGGICMARGDLSYAFTRGFGGMLPREIFLKWCNPTWKFLNPP